MPIFETDEERTYFLTTFLIHPDFLISDEGRNEGEERDPKRRLHQKRKMDHSLNFNQNKPGLPPQRG